jgi:hypothetical protein
MAKPPTDKHLTIEIKAKIIYCKHCNKFCCNELTTLYTKTIILENWGWSMSDNSLARSISEQQVEIKNVGLPIKKIMLSPTAENTNNNELIALYANNEQLFNEIYRHTDKLIDNFWQNMNFLDEIIVNYINNLTHAFTEQSAKQPTSYISNICELQKKLVSINEQTIFDIIDYIAVPAYKQNIFYITNSYSILNKQLHYAEKLAYTQRS